MVLVEEFNYIEPLFASWPFFLIFLLSHISNFSRQITYHRPLNSLLLKRSLPFSVLLLILFVLLKSTVDRLPLHRKAVCLAWEKKKIKLSIWNWCCLCTLGLKCHDLHIMLTHCQLVNLNLVQSIVISTFLYPCLPQLVIKLKRLPFLTALTPHLVCC